MTEKLKNQTKLSEVYESLIENTPTHLAYFDRDFTFLRVNSAYANGSGHTKDELVGRNHFELFPNEEYQRLFEQVRDTGQSIEFKAKPFKFTDQPWRGVTYRDWTLVPVKNDTGEVQGLVFSLTDVTEQERTRLSLEETINERERIEQVLQTISNKDSGSPIYTSISCAPIRNACGKISGAVATYSDMTNRKLAEINLWTKQEELTVANEALQAQQEELIALNEELRAQQEELFTTYLELQHQAVKLEATLSSIAAGAIIYDHSGNISRINEYARCLFGYNSRDYNRFYPERWARLNFCKSDGTRYEPDEIPLFRALQGEIIRDEEMIFTRNSESPAWISGTMAPIYDHEKFLIGVIFIFTDITERKRQVEDLLASERELLKVILNSLGEGVVAADREERIILINEAAANLTGYFGAEAIGAPLHKIFYVFDDKTSEPIDVNNPSLKYKNPILVTRDLREVPIAMNSSPIKAMDGRNIGTVTVFADISEKQKTERELLKAEKLESLGILAGGIAHDFNNVLAAILSNIQLAILKLAKNEDFNRYLWNTMEIARKASELTKQLLTFSKGGTPVKKDASLIELIRDTTEFVLRGARAKAEFAIPDNLWPASIDEGQISQVIHNLVINAKQAMPKGGIILIEAENVVVKEDTRYNPGNYVKITVTDQGIGIAKENLSKIFDPYFTTKKRWQWLGAGNFLFDYHSA